jgi:DNA repair protein SbcD/Mre11
MARLAGRFPHVLSVVFDPEGGGGSSGSYARRLTGRGDRQIVEDFVAHVRGGRPPDDLERGVLHAAVDAARVREAGESGW